MKNINSRNGYLKRWGLRIGGKFLKGENGGFGPQDRHKLGTNYWEAGITRQDLFNSYFNKEPSQERERRLLEVGNWIRLGRFGRGLPFEEFFKKESVPYWIRERFPKRVIHWN